jgi:hypothetical protein
MPIFRVDNFTRYSTEDLLSLLVEIEDLVRAANLPLQPARAQPYTAGPNIGHRIAIKTYATKRRFREANYNRPKVRNFVKERCSWRVEPEIRIVSPEQLPDSTLELVATAHEEEWSLPEEAVGQIATAMLALYEGAAGRGSYGPALDLTRPAISKHKVRVLPKPAQRETAKEREWMRRRKAQKALYLTLFEIRRFHEKSAEIAGHVRGLQKSARGFMRETDIQATFESTTQITEELEGMLQLYATAKQENDAVLERFWEET